MTQSGTAQVRIGEATSEAGTLRVETDQSGRASVRFPDYVASGSYPRAVITVATTAANPDALNPGHADFALTAEFKVDATSTGRLDDNGDNLIQRGLASDPAQYKLEIDRNRPACRVQGSRGVLQVRAGSDLQPDNWYVASCQRTGDSLILTVRSVPSSGEPDIATAAGPLGEVLFDDAVLVAVGGKVTRKGQIVRRASDQFNGSLAKAEFTLVHP